MRVSSSASRHVACVAAVLAAVLVALCTVTPAHAASTVGAFGRQYQAIMESAGQGFSMLYRDMTAPPVSYQWGCTTGASTTYSVAYASATAPYTPSVSATALTVTRAPTTSGVSYQLIGIACSYDATCGDMQSGSSISFTLQSNQIVMVAGTITSNGVVNFLPVAYYIIQPASACSSSNTANVTSAFSTGASPVWSQLWQ
ncbi:hypothetical protein NESM_000227900 [Novymonas esmeraldas]|uniref:Uncharacterized protein n=1 Tax=Novymonas esmeraldas TaxID=1808958 RepID=A0AAW0F4Y4_9TRYP